MRYWLILPFLLFSLFPSFAQVNLAVAGAEVSAGESFCLDITAEGFTEILSIQFRTVWDSTLLSFDSTANLGVENNGLLFSNQADALRFTWIATDFFTGASLEDGAILFSVCFTALKDGAGLVEIDENRDMFENPVPPEIANLSAGEISDVTFEKGTVTVGESTCSLILRLEGNDLPCSNSADGVIESILEGGDDNLTYNWSTGETTATIRNLIPGNYTLTVTDGTGCIALAEASIGAPDSMLIDIMETSTSSCASDLSITVEGGTAPHQYQMDNGEVQDSPTFSDVTGGAHRIVVIDASGCEQNSTITIEDKLEVGASCDDDDATTINDTVNDNCECKGETDGNSSEPGTGGETGMEMDSTNTGGTDPGMEIDSTNTGGETGMEIDSTNTGSGGTEMEMDSTNTGGGDSEMEMNPTNTPGNCQAVEMAVTRLICEGQSYEGYNESGDFTDTFKKADGCDSTRMLTLIVSNRVRTQVDTSICTGSMVAGRSEKGSYIDVFSTTSGCDSIRVLNIFILPSDDAQCSTTSVVDLETDPSFNIAPNPVQDHFTIEVLDNEHLPATISIYNIQGQLQFSDQLSTTQTSFSMQQLVGGMYLLVIDTETNTFVKRIVKM